MSEAPMLRPRAEEYREVSPLSFAQERLWFLDRLWPTAHNISLAYALTGRLNVEALRRSCHELVCRHEILRTHIGVRDGEAVQVVDAPSRFEMPTEDLSGRPAEERMAEVERQIAEQATHRFDLTVGPLFSVRLLKLAAAEHVLVVTMHHIVADGWSIGVLMRELTLLYEAYEQERTSPLPPLQVQYADYAVWQRQWLQGDIEERLLRHWQERLAGAPPVLELPSDRPRPAARSVRGASSRFTLSEHLSARLHQLARRERTTPFMVLLAAFQLVLARWSGEDDIVVGTPIAGRSVRQLEDLIGCFVNTLALRTGLSGNPSFAGLLRRVKQGTLDAYVHQDLPFERLVQALRPQRDLAHEPIVQVMLVQVQHQRAPSRIGDVQVKQLPTHALSHYDLTLHIDARSATVRGNVTYVADLFDATTIEAFVSHLTHTLEQVTQRPEARLNAMSVLTDAERERLLVTWNATRAPHADTECIHRLFERQVERSPDAVAVVDPERHVTYAALESRANRLARYLRARHLGPEARAALCLERRADVVTAMLAVLKAGGAYVPIDPAWPAERVRRILDGSRPLLILTESSLRSRVAGGATSARVVELDASPCPWAAYPASPPDHLFESPAQAAYAMFTSGSTGTPNGVVVEHGSVVNVLRAMRDLVDLRPDDCVLSVTTIAFDISVVELLLPLIAGARTTIVDRSQAFDPASLDDAMSRLGVSVAQATPVTWRMLVDHGWEGGAGLRAICGGEALPVELAARIRSRVARLWNVYGPTETTVWSMVHPVGTGFLDEAGYTSIGRPLRNTRVYLLDSAGGLAPVGVPGELHISGDGVARAYLNQPARTAERFLPDPFTARAGARMYRTGDIGRWRRDGTMEFIGRNDSQVKVHGFRIELGDVESHLKNHPHVRDAVVVVREDVPGERRLVAYYVPADGAVRARQDPEQPASFRQYLGLHLPEYMIPGAFVRLEAMPVTANRKVNRNALPPPTRACVSGGDHESPHGEIEGALASMWAQVLDLDRVGRHDDFFEIGGDSMSALRVVTRIEAEMAVRLPLVVMFSARTVADLAERVGAAQ